MSKHGVTVVVKRVVRVVEVGPGGGTRLVRPTFVATKAGMRPVVVTSGSRTVATFDRDASGITLGKPLLLR